MANRRKMKIRYVVSENELKSRGINDLKTFKINKNYFQKKLTYKLKLFNV